LTTIATLGGGVIVDLFFYIDLRCEEREEVMVRGRLSGLGRSSDIG
jgi:hypothetical protein